MNAPGQRIHAPWAMRSLNAMFARAFSKFRPRPKVPMLEWVEKYRRLSTEESPDFGGDPPRPFSLDNIPAMRGIFAACSDRKVRRVVHQKAAQAAHTGGLVCSILGYHIHQDPCIMVVMFPRVQSSKDFATEKFDPMIRSTKVLSRRLRLKSRTDGNSTTRKKFDGGLIKFVASNSPADVKSTTAKVRIVEEPDDTAKDVRGQGNSIALLRERGKTIRDSFELIGGTPTAKGASQVEKEMQTTDQRYFYAACHDCGETHSPEFEHVTIPGLNLSPEELADPTIDTRYPARPIYGRARWEDAFYTCPHCGSIWTDEQRVANIRAAAAVPPLYGWVPTADSPDPGFYSNELLAVFEGSYVPRLAEKYLRALHLMEQGDPTEMIAFENSTRGRCWEYKGELPEEDELRARAEKYAEWSVPAGGIEVGMNVDVQHDRLAVTVWASGRGDEMWLAYWGEHYGQTIVAHAGAWIELEQLMARKVTHATGAQLPIRAVTIDCGDGNTSDAVYAFVRRHNRQDRPVLATKGAPDDEGRVEIWTPPKAIDPNAKSTKASRYGVQVHIIGTAKAKDLILGGATGHGRIRLTGSGPGRMHWYEGVRDDLYEQLLSEIKIPSRVDPRKKRWKARTDRRNEALDCTVQAVYLSRHLKLHLRKPHQWDLAELRLRQINMLEPDEEGAQVHTPAHTPSQSAPAPAAPPEANPAPSAAQAQAPSWAALMSKRKEVRRV